MQIFESEVVIMAQKRDYATKKKGKTEVYPFWNLEDIKNVVEWFEKNEEWDGYLITLLELLRELFEDLSAKDKFVLSHSYGLFGEKKYTLDEIGLRLTMRTRRSRKKLATPLKKGGSIGVL